MYYSQFKSLICIVVKLMLNDQLILSALTFVAATEVNHVLQDNSFSVLNDRK